MSIPLAGFVERMSLKNGVSRFCNNFGTELVRSVWRREEKIENKNVLSHQQNCKTGHFTSWKEGEPQGNGPISSMKTVRPKRGR